MLVLRLMGKLPKPPPFAIRYSPLRLFHRQDARATNGFFEQPLDGVAFLLGFLTNGEGVKKVPLPKFRERGRR